MFEKPDQPKGTEKPETIPDLSQLNDQELETDVKSFLEEEVASLSQAAVEKRLLSFLTELSKRNGDVYDWFAFSLPKRVTPEEIQTGNSPWAKVYKSLFCLCKTTEYQQNPKLQTLASELNNIVDQNPQLIGPVAMWQTAKDIMWRKDIPRPAKADLMASMTYALAYENTDQYEAELLQNLNFEDIKNYQETAHMLEAIKQFWSSGHEGYAVDQVPDFYVRALRKVTETPKTNYLLFTRAREILSLLEQSEVVTNEASDRPAEPFELAKDTWACFRTPKGLTIIDKPDSAKEQKNESETSTIEDRLGTLGQFTADKKQALIFDYEFMVSRPTREMIQKDFAFALKDLSLREQFYFLNYLKRTTVADADSLKNFIKHHGVNGARAFLSLERGDETLGDQIVAFGQNHEAADALFKYYGELLDNAERAEALVLENGCEGEHCLQLGAQVRENIINRGQKDLETAVKESDRSELAAKIKTYVADAKVYVALLQEAIQQPLEPVAATTINDKDKAQILALSARNYANEKEDFQTVIRSGLEQALANPNSRFYIEKDKAGKVIFCDRFDDIKDEKNDRVVKYFGSVNAEPSFNGIGRVRIAETLEQELARGQTMFAHCDPKTAVSSLYVEHGFVATKTVRPAGKLSFEIWRGDDFGEQLPTKSLTVAALLEQFENQNQPAPYEIRKVAKDDQFLELDEGKYLTRYFRHNGEYYAVFEPAPPALALAFVPPE